MKRKILSLALALMMIISVAAALPVSAITSADLTEDVTYYNLDASTLTKTTDVESAGTVNVTNGNIYGTWNGTSYVDWTTIGVSEMNGNGKYARFSFEAAAGVYDMYIATGVLGTATSVNAEVTVNGVVPQTTYACATAGVQFKPAEAYIGQFVLNEGTNTVTIGATSNGVLYLYNVLLVRVDDTDIVYDAPVNHVKSSTDLVFTNDGQLAMEPTGVDWANKGTVQLFATGAATYNYIEVPQTGYYDVYAAVAQPNADASATLQVGGASNTASIAQTAGATTAAENNLGQFYLTANAANVVKFTANTSDTYLYNLKFVWADPQPAAQYTITANASAGGTATGTATVEEGESVTLTATPNSGYEFIGWFDENDNPACQTAVFEVNDVKADATYIAKFAVDPSIIIDASDTTSTIGTGRLWSRSATVNNVSWVDATGVGYFENGWNTETIPVVVPTPITTAGYYDVTLSYASRYDGGKIIVYFEGQSVDLQAALPATSTAEANYVAEELSLGKVYLDTTTDNVIVRAYAPDDPNSKSGTPVHFYGLKLKPTEENPTSVLINGALPTEHNGTELSYNNYAPVTSDVAWANQGAVRIPGRDNWAKYTVYIPETGYYTVSIATGTTPGGVAIVGLSIDDNSVIESKNLNVPFGGSNNNLMNPSSTILTRVQLNAGYRTFKVDGIQGTTQFRLFNIKLDKEDLPTANTIRITDTDDNNVPSVTGGSIVCAEVALPTDVEGAKIFLVQYAGEDDEKTMVATSYITPASEVAYTAGGYNFYRTQLKTLEGSGEVKAFLWKDGTYEPLKATVSATVR